MWLPISDWWQPYLFTVNTEIQDGGTIGAIFVNVPDGLKNRYLRVFGVKDNESVNRIRAEKVHNMGLLGLVYKL